MRTPVAAVVLVSFLIAACVSDAPDPPISDGGESSCVPGRQLACACPGGGEGVQVCREDGEAFGACTGCEATDGGGELPTGPCVHPLDGVGMPTGATCDRNVVVTCDLESHEMVRSPCGAEGRCAEYLITEYPNGEEGPSYAWAGCVPRDAVSCEFSYLGWHWVPEEPPRCEGNQRRFCEMAPVPVELREGELQGGTTYGTVQFLPCAADEACAQNSSSSAEPECFPQPLTLCSEYLSYCEGDALFTCRADEYRRRDFCSETGEICREGCGAQMRAWCEPPLPQDSVPCDWTTFERYCNGNALVRCGRCFDVDGECACWRYEEDCTDANSGVASTCKASETSSGDVVFTCVRDP